ncbi:MAG: tRNA epoxyqueuosine(34) reductase QueG [Alphaproteobacteria bacterium]|nr:MAG: tRNA epoxyqueuosine(34) reductase QueG [Alphaproteobacteria bacterium]
MAETAQCSSGSADEDEQSAALLAAIRRQAHALGFDALGVADPAAVLGAGRHLKEAIAQGWHGEMDWLAERAEERADPRRLWAEVRSVLMLGVNYGIAGDPLAELADSKMAAISIYARRKDYHTIIRKRLKQVAGFITDRTGGAVKVFVDTAPVMEKPLAEAAGLGWQGKHTNLVSRAFGSWLFLGAIFLDRPLPFDRPMGDHCGRCRRCLEACPTDAFVSARQLDARRCISYLTIEHRGPIPRELRPLMGNRVFGCDDCLAVCPWNKFARAGREATLAVRPRLKGLRLADLVQLDEEGFRDLFAGTPVKRATWRGFIRNVLIAIGNAGDRDLLALVREKLESTDPLVRGAAVWALARLASPEEVREAAARYGKSEPDPAVREEWRAALGAVGDSTDVGPEG